MITRTPESAPGARHQFPRGLPASPLFLCYRNDNCIICHIQVSARIIYLSPAAYFWNNPVRDRFDYERESSENVAVLCRDGGIDPPRTATMSAVVTVTDENDNAPYFEERVYDATVSENSPPGTEVIRVVAVDRDSGENGRVQYSLRDDVGGLFQVQCRSSYRSFVSLDTIVSCCSLCRHVRRSSLFFRPLSDKYMSFLEVIMIIIQCICSAPITRMTQVDSKSHTRTKTRLSVYVKKA